MKKFGLAFPFIFVLGLFFVFYFYGVPLLPAMSTDLAAARGQFGDSFGVLNSLFSGLGFAAVVVTIWMQQGQIKNQAQEHIDEVNERRSLFNLESSVNAYEQARILLNDHNNDRATWIHAARLIGHAKVFGEGVTIDAHQRMLEIKRMEYRAFFSQLLESKSGAFFYGSQNRAGDIDAAARESSVPEETSGRRILSSSHALPEESIYVIWEAAQWPKDYKDPLDAKFTLEHREKLILHTLGLKEYLEHRDQWRSFSGQLRPRTRNNVQD
jgi:hypothetical protein